MMEDIADPLINDFKSTVNVTCSSLIKITLDQGERPRAVIAAAAQARPQNAATPKTRKESFTNNNNLDS